MASTFREQLKFNCGFQIHCLLYKTVLSNNLKFAAGIILYVYCKCFNHL